MAKHPSHNKKYNNRQRERRYSRTLGNVGMGVFRTVEMRSPISSTLEYFDKITEGEVRRIRGQYIDQPPSLNQLSLRSLRNAKSLGAVPVDEALNEIYDEIPTLKKGEQVTVKGVNFFGNPNHSLRPVGLYFALDDQERLNFELREIVFTICRLAGIAEEWPKDLAHRTTPHVTLGHIAVSEVEKLKQLEEYLPDTLSLKQATMYVPITH